MAPCNVMRVITRIVGNRRGAPIFLRRTLMKARALVCHPDTGCPETEQAQSHCKFRL